jgi:hypothetical protein
VFPLAAVLLQLMALACASLCLRKVSSDTCAACRNSATVCFGELIGVAQAVSGVCKQLCVHVKVSQPLALWRHPLHLILLLFTLMTELPLLLPCCRLRHALPVLQQP